MSTTAAVVVTTSGSTSPKPATARAATLLPPLPTIPCPLDWRGPTPWSNWVIKGRVLAGAFPAAISDAETDAILTRLLELGVNTFVCLQAEFSLAAPESAWRGGQALRPYVKDAQRLLARARQAGNHRITQTRLDLLHLPIVDGSITSDHALSCLADDCCQRILSGERLYIHCWGGHGRTGTLVAVMLARLYGLKTNDAFAYTQAMHDVRRCPQGVRSPQTMVQIEQVRRILASERVGEKAQEYQWPTERLSSQEPATEAWIPFPSKAARPPPPPPVPLFVKSGLGLNEPPIRSESLIPVGVLDGGGDMKEEATVDAGQRRSSWAAALDLPSSHKMMPMPRA